MTEIQIADPRPLTVFQAEWDDSDTWCHSIEEVLQRAFDGLHGNYDIKKPFRLFGADILAAIPISVTPDKLAVVDAEDEAKFARALATANLLVALGDDGPVAQGDTLIALLEDLRESGLLPFKGDLVLWRHHEEAIWMRFGLLLIDDETSAKLNAELESKRATSVREEELSKD
ncbi:MAG: hypothetical protein ACM31O_01460 [Bacteroidota bacterium]